MRILAFFLLFTVMVAVVAAPQAGERERLPPGIMSASELIGLLEAQLGGEIVEIQFDGRDKSGRPAYEVYHVDASGRRTELKVDARTGRVLKRETDD
ncbi:putative membrane protein YkoI [Pseudochelatococcus lubricantis]|uniref:Membrane protein YkoI n=1 Tax=Pseudochelatococcus lubricantis TaxID=1538102 RepID=A0ABX0V3Q4_9HYPH|nr:PepSY domain-containing protein [Pseudochelatococcus lubricantis]NIJ59853.1 putative membrane protein YkoI [Pseudochelatococcus lubricantis]